MKGFPLMASNNKLGRRAASAKTNRSDLEKADATADAKADGNANPSAKANSTKVTKTSGTKASGAKAGSSANASKTSATGSTKTASSAKAAGSTKTAKRKPSAGARRLQAKIRFSKAGKIILVAIGCAAMLLSVSAMACSGVINQASTKEEYKLTGGIAATVNKVNITEDTITKQIMSTRQSGGYTSDKKWAQYLVDNDLTPESLRKQTIESLVQQELVEQAVGEYNITVSNDDVNKAWKQSASAYGGEDAMKSMIKQLGYTEATYKEQLKSSLAQQKLQEQVSKTKAPTDDEVIAYLNENLSTFNDARRSSNLLIKVDSKASDKDKEAAKKKAQEALDKIKSGEMTFEQAVKKYSDDTASAEKKGDVGWDKLTSFVESYQTALSKLKKGEMSGIVESDYGYHIILCTDYFHVDGKVEKIDQVPSAIKDYVVNILKTQKQQTAYQKWLTSYEKKAKITISPMPKDAPYNVSLKGVTKSATMDATGATGATGDAATTTTEGGSAQ